MRIAILSQQLKQAMQTVMFHVELIEVVPVTQLSHQARGSESVV
jgi:hypothetical protein